MRPASAVGAFVLLACVLSAPAFAAVRFGIVGGMQSTWMQQGDQHETDGAYPVSKSVWSGCGGLSLSVPLAHGFAVGTGLEYQPFVDRREVVTSFLSITAFDSTQVWGTSRIETRAHTIVLPLRLEYAHRGVRLGFGPQVRFTVSARQRLEATLGGAPPVAPAASARKAGPSGARANIFESVRSGQWYDATDAFLLCSVQPVALLGIDVPLHGHRLRLEGRESWGGTEMMWRQSEGLSPIAVQIAAGWEF